MGLDPVVAMAAHRHPAVRVVQVPASAHGVMDLRGCFPALLAQGVPDWGVDGGGAPGVEQQVPLPQC